MLSLVAFIKLIERVPLTPLVLCRYKAVYNYKPHNKDELELREGDILQVMERCDDGWFVGKLLMGILTHDCPLVVLTEHYIVEIFCLSSWRGQINLFIFLFLQVRQKGLKPLGRFLATMWHRCNHWNV